MTALAHRPLGGRILTKPVFILGIFVLIGAYFIARRFLFGLGDVSHMSNGYPLGVWVAVDVVVGTAFGCGGYAMALLVYIFNRNTYHPLMRPALLGGVLPAFKQRFNLEKLQAFLKRYMFVFIGLGVLLPTMHQSSLGSVLLVMGSKLSPLWYTAWLPLLYLISALTMGYSVVLLEATLVSRAFRLPSESALLAPLSRIVAGLLALFLVIRCGALLAGGHMDLAFAGDRSGNLFLIETALFLAPLFILASPTRRASQRLRFLAAICLLAAGSLYRINSYLMAVNPGNGWIYFPSAPELMITIGIVCLEILLYLLFIKTLPVLHGSANESHGRLS